MLEQENTPLLEALNKYISKKERFHFPGHGAKPSKELISLLGEKLFKADLTELRGLDDLHCPKDALKKSQGLAAKLFGVKESFFLINGSTCGLQALIMAYTKKDDLIILPRNIHRSILGGLILSGAKPIFFQPEVFESFQIMGGILPENIATILEKYPKIRAIFFIHPNYYGIVSDISLGVNLAKEKGLFCFADEAHGIHFYFHPSFPKGALNFKIDASVQSMHKTGGSLTQTSFLHWQGEDKEKEKIVKALSLLQSTSPSYPLMASLDGARKYLALEGKILFEKQLELSQKFKKELKKIRGIKVLDEEYLGEAGIYQLDPLRIVFSLDCLTGHNLANILDEKYNLDVEMADDYNVVLVFSFSVTWEHCDKFLKAIKAIKAQYKNNKIKNKQFSQAILPSLPKAILTPKEAYNASSRDILLEEAKGKISAEWVAVYPPGIPVLLPGEEINEEILEYLQQIKKRQIHGTKDGGLLKIKVIE